MSPKKIGDTRFIIPLKLGPFDAPFLIAHATYMISVMVGPSGLHELLTALQDEYKVPAIKWAFDRDMEPACR